MSRSTKATRSLLFGGGAVFVLFACGSRTSLLQGSREDEPELDAAVDAPSDSPADRFVIDARPFTCGNSVVEGTEECDLGPDNVDKPAFRISQPSGVATFTRPLVRRKSVEDFYDFSSASSHTGFEAVGESRAYLYADALSSTLSLIVTHGIDSDSSGFFQPHAQVNMDISGIPSLFRIAVADDRASEFFETSKTTVAGRWVFEWNSDGGAIADLPFPGAWKIIVKPTFIEGITRWSFVNTDLTRIGLRMTDSLVIESFDQPGKCRANCTVPRCGDGILDAGEVCDDGNVQDGDECASDCLSF